MYPAIHTKQRCLSNPALDGHTIVVSQEPMAGCPELFPFLIESSSRSPKNIAGLFPDPTQHDRESYYNQDHCYDYIDHPPVS